MNYSQALDIIIKKQSLGIQPGLERIYALLKKMGDPQKNLKIIHVAGTNGKGTVCCTLAKSLADHGLKVGLFTSPWVTDYREQIQINSSFISEKDLAGYIENYSAYDATEFELITAIAYKYFYDHNVDIAVVECGMGGAGDSTNAIPTPELAVITAVSMDHTDFLGNTLEDIAREKSGIIKEKGKVILYPNPKMNSIFKEKCKAVNAEWFEVEDTGDFYANDMQTVRSALHALGFDEKISEVRMPARCEYIADHILIDGAHNVGAALALERSLPDREITAVIGMMKDKDVDAYLKIIAPHCKRILATTPSNKRALPASELMMLAKKYCDNVTAAEDPLKAVQIKDYDFLLICGSFYLARDVRKALL